MTSVTVERLPFGTSTFAMAVADCFDHDVLTVSCTDQDFDSKFGPMRVFQPGQWAEAVVHDERGNVIYAYTSDAGTRRLAERRIAS